MPRVLLSGVVDAPVEKAWEIIRRFDADADWLPFVKSSPIEDRGDPTRVGCVRVVTQKDGFVFREVSSSFRTRKVPTPARSLDRMSSCPPTSRLPRWCASADRLPEIAGNPLFVIAD